MKYDKAFLRKKFLKRRRKVHTVRKKFNFNKIFFLIKKHFKNKKITIAGYYPSDKEVNILDFLMNASKKKYKIILPVIKPKNKIEFKSWLFKQPLYLNKFGILEPKDSKERAFPDLVLVPLVAFDKYLNRIGYGKGFYDRSLKKINKIKKKTIFLGIAYSFQKCDFIPVNKNDFKLDYIFTERGIIK